MNLIFGEEAKAHNRAIARQATMAAEQRERRLADYEAGGSPDPQMLAYYREDAAETRKWAERRAALVTELMVLR